MTKLIRKTHPLFEDFNRWINLWDDEGDLSKGSVSGWHPSVDIKETPSAFVLVADIPGVNPKDIEISMDNNVLTFKGDRNETKHDNNENYSRTERVHGSFFRQFTLPQSADSSRIEAESKHGVLELVIPKVEKAQPKKIDIKVVDA